MVTKTKPICQVKPQLRESPTKHLKAHKEQYLSYMIATLNYVSIGQKHLFKFNYIGISPKYIRFNHIVIGQKHHFNFSCIII